MFLQNCGTDLDCTDSQAQGQGPGICQAAVQGGSSGGDGTGSWEGGCNEGFGDYLQQQYTADGGPTYP